LTIKKANLLSGKRILLTRSPSSMEDCAKLFEAEGGTAVSFPVIDFIPADDFADFDEFFLARENIDYIVFTSVNSVRYFTERLSLLKELPDYERINIIAIGRKTASVCEEAGIRVGYTSPKQNARHLADYFRMLDVKGKTVLYPTSDLANDYLQNALSLMGAYVKKFVVYRTMKPSEEVINKYLVNLREGKPDWVVFSSPSSFQNFISITKEHGINDVLGDNIISIGETTSAEIVKHGFRPLITAEDNSMEGIVKSLVNYYKEKESIE